MALESMTGFASAEGEIRGEAGGARWRWEARSVNGRGLDLRLRLPEGWERREPELRKRAAQALSRGSVSAQLRVEAVAAGGEALDPQALDAALSALAQAGAAAERRGVALAPPSAAELLRLPGVSAAPRAEIDEDALADVALAGFDALLTALIEAREGEGRALRDALSQVLDEIAAATAEAADAHAAQAEAAPARLTEKVRALQEAGAEPPQERLAQELALLAVRNDVREELDRLRAHIDAARALLAETGAVGRRLDFLTQEFNREANTLCSKSASVALTEIGLRLKALIDQMREQTQNLA